MGWKGTDQVDVPAARQLERPAWLNARTIAGLVLMVIAFVGGQRILRDARTTVSFWSAAADLPRGAELTTSDLVPAEVRLPGSVAERYVGTEAALEGAVLERAVTKGELIPSAWIATGLPSIAGREMTIPVAPEHAVGGSLGTGDIVDVFATFQPEGAPARTTLIARAIEVLSMVESGGLVLDEQAKVGVTVAVSSEEAARLAFAIRTAELDVVRVVGRTDREPARDVQEGEI
jgi:Flp pilus assembly protein CpaB